MNPLEVLKDFVCLKFIKVCFTPSLSRNAVSFSRFKKKRAGAAFLSDIVFKR